MRRDGSRDSTGEFGMAWAHALREAVEEKGDVLVALPPGTPEHGVRLVAALGAIPMVTEHAPPLCKHGQGIDWSRSR